MATKYMSATDRAMARLKKENPGEFGNITVRDEKKEKPKSKPKKRKRGGY